MKKEPLIEVEKVWGQELWFTNNELYCGKLLIVDEGAECSYHRHPVKKETFMCLEGYVELTIEGKTHMLAPFTRAKTIDPGEWHSYKGITAAVIIEVSTHHEDKDVERRTQSKPGGRAYGTDT